MANPLLFEENFSNKDCCLNRSCWQNKTRAHIQIQRRKIVETELQIAEPEKIAKAETKIPFLTDRWYWAADERPAGEKCLTTEDYKELKKPDECKSATHGVFYLGDRIGQSALICANKECKTHFKRSSTNDVVDRDAELEKKRQRKEEIVDVNVGEPVRRRVLKIAAECFDAESTVLKHPKADEYYKLMVDRLWTLQCDYSDYTAEVIREALGLDDTELSKSDWRNRSGMTLHLSPEIRERLLFLLLFAHHDELFQGGSWKSQKHIKEIADDFEIDYQLLDAQERLGYARMKDKDVFRNYLQEIEAGNRSAKIPRVYSDKYQPED
jgi:hypothetical protein